MIRFTTASAPVNPRCRACNVASISTRKPVIGRGWIDRRDIKRCTGGTFGDLAKGAAREQPTATGRANNCDPDTIYHHVGALVPRGTDAAVVYEAVQKVWNRMVV